MSEFISEFVRTTLFERTSRPLDCLVVGAVPILMHSIHVAFTGSSLLGFSDANGYDMHSLMVLHYEHQAKVNGKIRSTCLLLYNRPKKRETLVSYEAYFHSKADVLYYLAAHEFAHCMAMHQTGLGKMTGAQDNRAHELLADKVAIAFFLSNGNTRGAQRIVDFNRTMINPKSDHYHPKELAAFLERTQSLVGRQTPRKTSMHDLFLASTAR